MITKPCTFALLEEGRLAVGLDEDLSRATHALLAHVAEYGVEATTKSKAKLTLEITIAPMNAADGTFVYTAKVKTQLPGRPAYATTAIMDRDSLDGNKQTLFVRASTLNRKGMSMLLESSESAINRPGSCPWPPCWPPWPPC